ncbi:MAG: hypothetical protein VXY92_12635 [Planctomycetota bacterium]|nr:hypothetical protein [Planctomycetota bacterium]
MRRLIWNLTFCLGALGTGGCSVAGSLTGEELLDEMDAIVSVEGAAGSRRAVYEADAVIMRDFMRIGVWTPIRAMTALLLDKELASPLRELVASTFGRVRMQRLVNPEAHVRALLRAIPERTDRGWVGPPSLDTCGRACAWFAWLAELAPNQLARIHCLDGLSRMCRQLDLEPFDVPAAQLLETVDAGVAGEAWEALRAHFRGDAAAPNEVAATLEALTRAPLGGYDARATLIEDLLGWRKASDHAPTQQALTDALRRALAHAARRALLDSVMGRSRTLAEVRLCGMEQIRRLAGPAAVPLLLALMSASPQERAAGQPAFDTDTLVMLRLIHYCGQLPPDRAREVVRLPGRLDWEATSAAEFLAQTILSETAYYSELRAPAIVALTWCLGRPTIDLDPAWVRAWFDNRDA